MSKTHGEWLDRIRGRKTALKKDDELYLIFCNPLTAIDFLGCEDAVVMTPLIPEDEVTLVQKDEFLEWLNGKGSKK